MSHLEFSCPDNCNQVGLCTPEAVCICYKGYFKDDCSGNLRDSLLGGLITSQVFLGLVYLILFVVSLTAAFFSLSRHSEAGLITKIRGFLYSNLTTITAINFFIIVLDPVSQYHVLPHQLHYVLGDADLPLLATAYLLVLFHWIELVHTSINSINQENMRKQINTNYPGKDITFEDVIEAVKVLKKFRIPFLIISILSFACWLICDVMIQTEEYPFTMYSVQFLYFVLLWICMTAGFLGYRRRMVSVMPSQLSDNVKKMTTQLVILSVSNLLTVGFLLLISRFSSQNAHGAFALYLLDHIAVIAMTTATLLAFLPLRKRFPFVDFSSSSSSTSSGASPANVVELGVSTSFTSKE